MRENVITTDMTNEEYWAYMKAEEYGRRRIWWTDNMKEKTSDKRHLWK